MNKYGKAAIRAVQIYKEHTNLSPREAWNEATSHYFPGKPFAQNKGCPRAAFLGLCEEGFVRGIPRETYQSGKKNKQYAIDAVHILNQNPEKTYTPSELWKEVTKGKKKQHNQQMDVVLALWENSLINIPKDLVDF